MSKLLIGLFVTQLLVWLAAGLFGVAILWAVLIEARRVRARR